MAILVCLHNVAAGIVLISLAVYLFFVCFLIAGFWRNEDAHTKAFWHTLDGRNIVD